MSQHMKSFEDTVNLLTDIDLVVTVDTALLHVAGAMGIPTMAMLSYNPDWRWEIKGKTTDWYDSVRLFRQPELGNWEVPFKEMIEEVKSL
jgi:ADP-heptose:LPS heptosyltransferase